MQNRPAKVSLQTPFEYAHRQEICVVTLLYEAICNDTL